MVMPIDTTGLTQIGSIIIPIILGWAAKWLHGNVITKVNSFRAVVDDIDNILQSGTATPQQLTDVLNQVKTIIAKAQLQ